MVTSRTRLALVAAATALVSLAAACAPAPSAPSPRPSLDETCDPSSLQSSDSTSACFTGHSLPHT